MCVRAVDGQHAIYDEVSMSSNCTQCEKWANKKREALETCDSIFDAYREIMKFENSCSKTCPYLKENSDNS